MDLCGIFPVSNFFANVIFQLVFTYKCSCEQVTVGVSSLVLERHLIMVEADNPEKLSINLITA